VLGGWGGFLECVCGGILSVGPVQVDFLNYVFSAF
jgi:hypothetical protein